MKDFAKEAGWVLLTAIFAIVGACVVIVGGACTAIGMGLLLVITTIYDKIRELSPFKDAAPEEKKEDPD